MWLSQECQRMPASWQGTSGQSCPAACHLDVNGIINTHLQELAEARRTRRQPTRMNGYGSRTSSPSRDGVSPVRTPAVSPAKPNR